MGAGGNQTGPANLVARVDIAPAQFSLHGLHGGACDPQARPDGQLLRPARPRPRVQ